MAVRSGAGTGVIVSLVVFVLSSIFLLILSIVFYAGQLKEQESRVKSDNDLGVYVTPTQQSSDLFQNHEQAARQRNQSVAMYLHGQNEALMRYVDGDPGTKLEDLQTKLGRYGAGADTVVRNVLEDKTRESRALQNEVDSLNARLQDQDESLAQLEATLDQAKAAHEQELDAVRNQVQEYSDAGNSYRQQVDDTIADLQRAKDTLRGEYEEEKSRLENEVEDLSRERVILISRLNELEAIVDKTRIKPQNPAMLVDGNIIDAAGPSDRVFIDRGKQDRIVLGMTFEVYDDAASIRVNPRTGELPRGKASLQVIKVGDATSTCKITRAVPGRPVVRGDVVANAVYDPSYQFKFMVHGKFDIDLDGRPSEAEAEYLRSLILDWGGTVVTGEDLPGDLDFLVLGVQPPEPGLLPPDAPEALINDFIRKRRAREKYDELFDQAREAQIPVLNANRFFILLGHTDR
ncbi:MAG: hypothetical protein ACYTG1_05215 [Planctomycetota bacterium]|jgi:hypothetical protein